MMYGHGSGIGWTLIVLLVALPALLIAAVLIVTQLGHSPADPPAPEPVSDAERVLADRFARGEIGAEEYERRLHTLRSAHR